MSHNPKPVHRAAESPFMATLAAGGEEEGGTWRAPAEENAAPGIGGAAPSPAAREGGSPTPGRKPPRRRRYEPYKVWEWVGEGGFGAPPFVSASRRTHRLKKKTAADPTTSPSLPTHTWGESPGRPRRHQSLLQAESHPCRPRPRLGRRHGRRGLPLHRGPLRAVMAVRDAPACPGGGRRCDACRRPVPDRTCCPSSSSAGIHDDPGGSAGRPDGWWRPARCPPPGGRGGGERAVQPGPPHRDHDRPAGGTRPA